MQTTDTTTRPTCSDCGADAIRWGKDRSGNQRWRCRLCSRTWSELPARPLGSMRLPVDRAVLVLSLLVEGNSIRSAERVTGHHRDTITRLLVLVGGKCAALLDSMIQGVEVANVQADEIWSYVAMKERTKKAQGITDPEIGDAYTYVAIERDSKLVLTHHLGRRNWNETEVFISKLAKATAGQYQLTTDGWDGYPYAVTQHLGHRVDYAQLIKEYGQDVEGARRYSPPRIIGSKMVYLNRFADPDAVCTRALQTGGVI
jgi:transposase-like protein/IS1 family transposase